MKYINLKTAKSTFRHGCKSLIVLLVTALIAAGCGDGGGGKDVVEAERDSLKNDIRRQPFRSKPDAQKRAGKP